MISIVNYKPEHQQWFESLNREWIEMHFRMEEIDVQVLTQPEKYILKDGGAILMALWNDDVAGTVALKKADDGNFELTKMAVNKDFRGKGIGEALVHAAINKAKEMGAKKVILYSNTKLSPAIQLYRKTGFAEVPVEEKLYDRCNIKMETNVILTEKMKRS